MGGVVGQKWSGIASGDVGSQRSETILHVLESNSKTRMGPTVRSKCIERCDHTSETIVYSLLTMRTTNRLVY